MNRTATATPIRATQWGPAREGQSLYAAWRTARARWDLARYDRPNPNDDLPDEVDAAHCTAEHSALRAYLLHHEPEPFALERKLYVMVTEGAANFDYVDEVIEVLAKDAGIIAQEYLRLRSAATRSTAAAPSKKHKPANARMRSAGQAAHFLSLALSRIEEETRAPELDREAIKTFTKDAMAAENLLSEIIEPTFPK